MNKENEAMRNNLSFLLLMWQTSCIIQLENKQISEENKRFRRKLGFC